MSSNKVRIAAFIAVVLFTSARAVVAYLDGTLPLPFAILFAAIPFAIAALVWTLIFVFTRDFRPSRNSRD